MTTIQSPSAKRAEAPTAGTRGFWPVRDLPVVARVRARHVEPGETIRVRLTAAEPATRRLAFQRMA